LASNCYIPIKRISLAKQALILRLKYPDAKCQIKNNKLVWNGNLRPSALSRWYQIKIIYHDYSLRPKVILYGDIPGITRSDFPHHFSIDREKNTVELCLHMPYEFDGREQIIADLIIPWTQEWLYFYEIWLATGKWCGGGHSPSNK
jgi:hypothetical protein